MLAECRLLHESGVIRRYGASINHRKAGFEANAMVCWAVADNVVEAAGHRLASLPEVSHCYERKTNAMWRFNLFAMVHGQERHTCEEIADAVSSEFGPEDRVVLFSTREFKKERIKYSL